MCEALLQTMAPLERRFSLPSSNLAVFLPMSRQGHVILRHYAPHCALFSSARTLGLLHNARPGLKKTAERAFCCPVYRLIFSGLQRHPTLIAHRCSRKSCWHFPEWQHSLVRLKTPEKYLAMIILYVER